MSLLWCNINHVQVCQLWTRLQRPSTGGNQALYGWISGQEVATMLHPHPVQVKDFPVFSNGADWIHCLEPNCECEPSPPLAPHSLQSWNLMWPLVQCIVILSCKPHSQISLLGCAKQVCLCCGTKCCISLFQDNCQGHVNVDTTGKADHHAPLDNDHMALQSQPTMPPAEDLTATEQEVH